MIPNNGIKFSVPWQGSGTEFDPYRPQTFGSWPDAYYVVGPESDDPETTDARAVCWVDPNRSPGNAVDAIADSQNPVYQVLEDNR
jgi:hypothetical protein